MLAVVKGLIPLCFSKQENKISRKTQSNKMFLNDIIIPMIHFSLFIFIGEVFLESFYYKSLHYYFQISLQIVKLFLTLDDIL